MRIVGGQWIRFGGLIIALISFGITRLFVAEAVKIETTQAYILAGLIPLTIGLIVTIYGVTLTIGTFSREYVNTVASGAIIGTFAVVVILIVTSIDSLLRGEGFQMLIESPLLVANILLGGTVGGIAIGTRAAITNRQRR